MLPARITAFKRVLNRRFFTAQVGQLPYERIHSPVMLNEVLEYLAPKPGGVYCDLTFGDGGYTKAILDTCDCKVVAMDQDPTAYEKAQKLANMEQYRGRLIPILNRFGQVHSAVSDLPWKIPCFDGMVMDIGVSSGQIETASRGFSYKLDGPLDMRMFSRGRLQNAQSDDEARLIYKSISAYELVNFFPREQLADIIFQIPVYVIQYGGDRLSRKIADAIVAARQKAPIETTGALATIIQKACPQPRWQRGDDDMLRNSAARTFQALRIYINDELGELKNALRASEYLLKPQGRLVVVTFHSLEDRIAKNFMHHCSGRRSMQEAELNQFDVKRSVNREWKKATRRGQDLLLKQPQAQKTAVSPSFQLCSKHVVHPSREETHINPRSRSAKLRAAERTNGEPLAPFGSI
ncbi:hypothetical protein EC973_004305 [Apophysomyces ossiformis]|uniref:Uncharacterized protein n=1 Tax=Apophysomyces ossiformis TaxID=679940 RepID=A0A8H7BG43_9FUNG|nr:hypothetical protein EC973_004305 [Apophysomyces ossiformis]